MFQGLKLNFNMKEKYILAINYFASPFEDIKKYLNMLLHPPRYTARYTGKHNIGILNLSSGEKTI